MNIDVLVKLARLGLAGAAVLFAFLGYRLLSASASAHETNAPCVANKIQRGEQVRSTLIAETDRVTTEMFTWLEHADNHPGNLQRAYDETHQAHAQVGNFRKALAQERDTFDNLVSELKMCGRWTPFYAWITLQMLLAILLFALEFRSATKRAAEPGA